MKLSRNIFLIVWALISVLLIGLYAVSLHIQTGTIFFLALNTLNAVIIFSVFLFKKKIGIAVESIIHTYESIQNSPSETYNIIVYSHESGFGRFFVLIVSTLGLYVAVLSLWDPKGYWQLIKEDGIVEYASFSFWFLAALVLLLSLARSKLRSQVYKLQTTSYLLLIGFFIICGGEEISWGQRIFSLRTPDFLKTINVQNEITLHNIGSISIFSNAFFLLTVIFFLLVPYIRSKSKGLKKFIDFLAIPTPNRYVVIVYGISLGIWVFVGVRFGTLGFHPFSFYTENYYNQMDDEIFECLAAYSFLCFSVMEALKETELKRNL